MAGRIIRHPLTVPEQCRDMRHTHPEFKCLRSHAGMSWTGRISPTPLSEVYTIEIAYRRRRPPQVWVKEPDLRVSKEDYSIVHIYAEGCLCLHEEGEWRPWMTLSSTFIPWAAEWLLYYELWLATGQWYGGGEYRVASRRSA